MKYTMSSTSPPVNVLFPLYFFSCIEDGLHPICHAAGRGADDGIFPSVRAQPTTFEIEHSAANLPAQRLLHNINRGRNGMTTKARFRGAALYTYLDNKRFKC